MRRTGATRLGADSASRRRPIRATRSSTHISGRRCPGNRTGPATAASRARRPTPSGAASSTRRQARGSRSRRSSSPGSRVRRFNRRRTVGAAGCGGSPPRPRVMSMASIREVAQLSGVSVATVSRVLNGSAPVREETRQRVLERVRELDYVPNAAARTLVRRRSQVIGVVVNTGDAHPDLKHPFFGEVLVGLKQALGASRYDLLLFTAREGFLRRAVHHQLDGLVLMGVDRRDPDLRGALERGLPAMNVDLDVSGRRAGYVMSDNVGGARLATRRLIDLGHTRIATITGLSNTKPAIDRLRGYREELAAHRLPGRAMYVRKGDFYAASGHEQTHRLLGLQRPPTAIFAASDEMAIGAVSAI